jgi:hypothetical protein
MRQARQEKCPRRDLSSLLSRLSIALSVEPVGKAFPARLTICSQYGKLHPVIISETSAPYTYAVPSNMQYCNDCDIQGDLPDVNNLQPMPSDASSEFDTKISWLRQLTSDETAGRFPNLTAICFFNYFKYGSMHGDNDVPTLKDFRAIGGHADTEATFRQIVGNVTAYQGGYIAKASSSFSINWLFSAVCVVFSIFLWTF